MLYLLSFYLQLLNNRNQEHESFISNQSHSWFGHQNGLSLSLLFQEFKEILVKSESEDYQVIL